MLEIIVAILYFINKIFLALDKNSGWAVGIMASALATIYFFGLELYLFFSLEFACLMIMIFGYFGAKNTKLFSYVVYGIITIVMIYLLISIEESGVFEFITSILFMLAYLLLAHKNWHLGWIGLMVSVSMMFFVAWSNEQHFFAIMQGLSVIICLYAIWSKPKSILLNSSS